MSVWRAIDRRPALSRTSISAFSMAVGRSKSVSSSSIRPASTFNDRRPWGWKPISCGRSRSRSRKTRREFVDGHGREPLPGIEPRRRKARLVRGIREMLRLETDGAADRIGLAAFADVVWRLACEEVPGVELHAGLRRVDLHDPARNGIGEACGEAQLVCRLVEDVVVVIARAELQLFVAFVDPRADTGRPREVQGRALDGPQLTGGNRRRVDRREAVGVDRQIVIENVSLSLAAQVEER